MRYLTPPLSPPANATLADKKHCAELKIKHFKALESLMAGVVECFDSDRRGSVLHACVERVAKTRGEPVQR